jgi:HK97 family phage major capsid protein
MSTQTRSAAEIQQEAEGVSRTLEHLKRVQYDLLASTKKEDGTREVLPRVASELKTNELELAKLTDRFNALQYDALEAKTREDLDNLKGQPSVYTPRLHSPNGGEPESRGDAAVKHLPKTLGDAFIEEKSYKSWRSGGANQMAYTEVPIFGIKEYAVKATFDTTGFTSYERPPGAILLGQQELTVADLFGQGRTNSPTIRYLQEDTFTNAATTVAEGAAKPEATWDLSEVDAQVRKIAVITKVTDELFADYQQIRSYINERLPFMVRQREEFQLLSGDGVAPNILGVLATPGILTQARGADTNIDAIYKGITKVRTEGFFEPDAIVIDPTNWTPIRLAKETTGGYIYAHPAIPGPETLFGKRVVVTANMTDNTALVGAFRVGGTVFYREGLRVEATNSNEDVFEKNLITIRAEQRETLVIWRPKAFATVTGLATT